MFLVNSFGTIATILFVMATFFQAVKTYKDGHAESLSYGLLWNWSIGLFLMFLYTFIKFGFDPILVLNYGGQLLMVLFIKKYKYFPRK